MEGGKKKCLCLVFLFFVDQIVSLQKFFVLGHFVARATSYCLLPDTL